GDQIRGAVADDVATKNLAVFLVHHQLHESLLVTRGDGLAQGAEGEFSGLHLIPARLCLFLAQADHGDLGLAVNTGGNAQGGDRLLTLAGPELDRRHTFLRGRMRPPGRTVLIPRPVDCVIRRAHLLLNLDVAAVQLYPQRFQTETGAQGGAPHRDQDFVGGTPLQAPAVLDADFDPAGEFFYAVELGPRQDLDAPFPE